MSPTNCAKTLVKFTGIFACLPLLGTAFAQTAPPTNGLQLWLRADAGVSTNAAGLVETWEDQSGNNNHAMQHEEVRRPMLVGNAITNKPAVRFDGSATAEEFDFLEVMSAAGLDIVGDISTFAVIRADDYSNYNSIWGKTAGATGNIPAPTDWYLGINSGIPQLFRGDGGAFGNVGGERPIPAGNYVVIGARQTGTDVTHYLNDTINGTGTIPDTVFPADAGTNLRIGSREDGVTRMKGDIAELLIYSEALSDADAATAINYLRNKYGILNARPQVTISAPANNTSVAAPGLVTVNVTASDPDGSIVRVDLRANGTLIGTATAAPYSFPVVLQSPGTNMLWAIAVDNRDSTATSSIVNLIVTSAGPAPTLETSPNLKLWLRADQGVTTGPGGGVTEWVDQSGNNNNAAQTEESNAPTVGELNGQPALDFDGVDDFMDIPDSESLSIVGEMATFAVVRFDDFAGFRAIWGKTFGNQARPTDYYLNSGSGIPNVWRGYYTDEFENVNQNVAASGAVAAGTPVIVGFNQTGTTLTHYRNLAPNGSGTISLIAQDADTPLRIGSRDDGGTRMKGEMAELLIYDGALTPQQLTNVLQYLAVKYSIPSLELSNAAPVVTMGEIAQTNVTAGSTIELTATATDEGGSVVQVSFLANGSPVATDTSSPFSASLKANGNGPVTLAAVATDNLGRRSTSAPVSINITGGGTLPIPANGLSLWVRADQGANTNAAGGVTVWEDWSGNFNNATQTIEARAPMLVANALNGRPVLLFDGTDDSLTVPSSPSLAIAGDVTTLWVANFDDYGTFRTVWAKTQNNLPAANDYYLLPNSGVPRFYHGNPAGAIAPFEGNEPVPMGEYSIAGYRLEGEMATHFLNGAENGSGGTLPAGADAGTPLLIGTRADGVTRFKGTLAEIVIYNRALAETEINQVVTYFQNKYALGDVAAAPSISVQRSGVALVFAWPEAGSEGFVLESTTALGAAAAWTAVTDPVVPANGQNTVTVQPTGTARFFRLARP